jgi:hypothetical protein
VRADYHRAGSARFLPHTRRSPPVMRSRQGARASWDGLWGAATRIVQALEIARPQVDALSALPVHHGSPTKADPRIGMHSQWHGGYDE